MTQRACQDQMGERCAVALSRHASHQLTCATAQQQATGGGQSTTFEDLRTRSRLEAALRTREASGSGDRRNPTLGQTAAEKQEREVRTGTGRWDLSRRAEEQPWQREDADTSTGTEGDFVVEEEASSDDSKRRSTGHQGWWRR